MPIDDSYYCDCGHIIHNDWDYCPGCGKPTGNNTELYNDDDYDDVLRFFDYMPE